MNRDELVRLHDDLVDKYGQTGTEELRQIIATIEMALSASNNEGNRTIHPTIRKGLRKIVDGRAPTNEFERGFLEASRAVLVQADALEAHAHQWETHSATIPMGGNVIHEEWEKCSLCGDIRELVREKPREKSIDDMIDRLHKRGNGVDY